MSKRVKYNDGVCSLLKMLGVCLQAFIIGYASTSILKHIKHLYLNYESNPVPLAQQSDALSLCHSEQTLRIDRI